MPHGNFFSRILSEVMYTPADLTGYKTPSYGYVVYEFLPKQFQKRFQRIQRARPERRATEHRNHTRRRQRMKHTRLIHVILAVAAICALPYAFAGEASAVRLQVVQEAPAGLPLVSRIIPLTSGPKTHFCGYYGICPWNATGRYLFCLETDFDGREVGPEDIATLYLIDVGTGELKPIAKTGAWNFQQGALVHWLGTAPDRQLIYNDRPDGALCAVILDVDTGEKRILPQPLSAVAHSGEMIASISYARLNKTRPGYGYPGATGPGVDEPHPDNDGLYVTELDSGERRLIVTLDQVFRDQAPPSERVDDTIWFNHVLFNSDDSRIFFLARFKNPVGSLISAVYTVAPDGTDLRCVIPYAWNASHYDWRNARQLMVSSRFQAGHKWLHVLFTDGLDDHAAFAPEVIGQDGHCHFSPDGQWLVSDSYPRGKERLQSLYLGHVDQGSVYEAARLHQPETFKRDWRCDLHPRWSRDGKQLCIDSTHEGTRQVYLVELRWP